jgi:uncharacterized protein YuzE
MRLTYDATTDVAYLSLRPLAQGECVGPTLLLETDRAFVGFVALDFSLADGRAVGLEFQRASACLPAELLATAERLPSPARAEHTRVTTGRPGVADPGDDPRLPPSNSKGTADDG